MRSNPNTKRRELKAKMEKELFDKYRNTYISCKTTHTIIIGDCRRMDRLENNSVDLIVTSPPYFNAKEYAQWSSLKGYLEDMKKAFEECLRVLKPGRKFCLNISDLPQKGKWGVRWIPLGAGLLLTCQDVGFEIVDRIIWLKTPMKGFQYGSLPYPPSPLICDSIEYIFILRKPGKSDYSYLLKERREASRLRRKEYAEFTKQIWTIRRVRAKENINGHIAPFPDEIPYRCIKLYSFVGDTVLDPFGGSGTTTKMAIENKRNSILYEIKGEYLDIIKDKVNLSQRRLTNDELVIIHERDEK